MKHQRECVIEFSKIRKKELSKLFLNVTAKFCGIDPVHTSPFKSFVPRLLPIIYRVVSRLLTEKKELKSLKEARLKPLCRKPLLNKENVKTHLHVSNLAFCWKLIENL